MIPILVLEDNSPVSRVVEYSYCADYEDNLRALDIDSDRCVIVEELPEPYDSECYDLYYDKAKKECFLVKKPEVEPTETDIMNAEILLNQADIIAKQNEHDEVLAEILLNQMGV